MEAFRGGDPNEGFLSFLPRLKLTPTRASNSKRARAHTFPGFLSRDRETCSHSCQGVRPARLGSARLSRSPAVNFKVGLCVGSVPTCQPSLYGVACASPFLSLLRALAFGRPPRLSSPRSGLHRASRKKRHVSVRSVIISCTLRDGCTREYSPGIRFPA